MALMPAGTRPRSFSRRAILPAVIALALAALALAGPPRATAVPSAVVHYGPSLPSAMDQYAAPGNVIVVTAEQRNRNPARIRAWRASGAIVLAYVNLVDYSPSSDSVMQSLYGGAFPSAWYYPGGHSNYGGRPLMDLRASSATASYNGFTGTFGQYAARWIRNEVIKDGSLFNGVLLDVWGSRLWHVSSVPSGPGSDWEAGIARWGAEMRSQVGPNIFLVGNNTQTRTTARPLNGRMWESFDGDSPGYNHLTGQGEGLGLVYTFVWPEWHKPQLDILWRNEANPSAATRNMLVSSANRVTKTGSDVVVGSSDHNGGFPAPFGGGGGQAPPGSSVPPAPAGGGTPAPAPGGAGGGGAGGSGGTGGSGGARGRDALLRSSFETGVVSPWSKIAAKKGRIAGTAKGVAFVAGRSPGSFAALVAEVPAQSRVRVAVRLRLEKITLRRGGARALLALGAGEGHERQVGVMRTRKGLVWAAWTRTSSGARIRVTTGTRVRVRRWVSLKLATNWTGPRTRDVVRVDGAVVVKSRAGRLSGRRAGRVMVGIGRASSARDQAAVVVKRVSVAGG